MKTNFFKNIASPNAHGIWKISIHYDANGNFVVSALYSSVLSNEPALKTIAPLILKGTAIEMGEGFFEAIEKPVQATAGLYSNIEAYNKNLDNAKKKLSKGNKNQSSVFKMNTLFYDVCINYFVNNNIRSIIITLLRKRMAFNLIDFILSSFFLSCDNTLPRIPC
jgi:PRTRC genetic system protein E